ncbi:SKA complex subunit 1-like [Oratosquilla oratoria]|uniref:SKA complex subunit 1-like n=1 Tax=Oratosquilla oratoria TaxID=337810 RepID=UPI003F75ED46
MLESNKALTFEELENDNLMKIKALKICSDLRGGWDKDTVQELKAFHDDYIEIRKELESYREIVNQGWKALQVAQELTNQQNQMKAQMKFIKENLPEHLPTDQGNSRSNSSSAGRNVVQGASSKEEQNTAKAVLPSDGSKVVKGKKNWKPFQFITVEEFETVPKYIRGRLQYDQVNKAVTELNKTLEAKYALLSRPRNKLRPMELKNVHVFKQQETTETAGTRFVVDSDIKQYSKLRLDTAGRAMLTVLRTLKHLQEIRGPGNLMRYAVRSPTE